MNGIDPEESISKHRNIYDFTRAVKANKDYFYRQIDRSTGKITDMAKLVRYYCSTQGDALYKIKHLHSTAKGPVQSVCESKSKYLTVFNTPFDEDKWEDYHVDVKWYVDRTKEIIHKLEPEVKRADKFKEKRQITMFD